MTEPDWRALCEALADELATAHVLLEKQMGQIQTLLAIVAAHEALDAGDLSDAERLDHLARLAEWDAD